MSRKTVLCLVFFAFLLTMCKRYESTRIAHTNGLSCQNYTDYRFFEWRGEEYDFYIHDQGATCSYMCPDGTVIESDIPGKFDASSPLISASKAELDAQFCGVAFQATPTQSLATESPTPAASPTAAASPTVQASATAEKTMTSQPPVLTGGVTMCDTGANLISFRIVQPSPDLTGKTLTAQIAEQESSCYVNPTNPSLMTCTIPAGVTFPARVVLSVDGAVVNDSLYNGLGCEEITTPVATTTP